MPNDLTQAKLLIKACLETKDPYLDLGRCGITDLSDLPELFECTHLKTLVLSDAWYDYKSDKKFESSNLGKPNSLLVISSNIIKLKNLEKLILSDWYENWKIKDLSFLKFLSGLKYLDISHNYNSDCSFLENLTALHTLYLINNRIIDYRFLKNLTALQSLDLRRNRILACSFLENLTALQSLFLSENYISDCSFLENLTALQTLILRENHISDCSFLEKLPPLRSLDLSRNNISNYSFLDNLVLLQSLKLSENHITDCSFLEKLPALQSLDLSRNYISDCRFLEKLTALQSLNLNNNQISDCSFLEKLTALQSLNLNWNQISDCRFLEKLTVSQSLDLRNNNIKEIPSSIFKSNREVNLEVYGSAGLSLYGNPIKSPPIEIFKRGKEAITEWFKGQRISVNEVKVLLVGHGEVGKTTLVKCLTGEKPDPKESATHQIKITSHSIKHNQTVIKLNFWDFGGQEVMHSTHQFFLSSRSIYILVLDGRMDEDPEYWLKHIESFGGNSPVLIALNKADTNPGYDLNRQFLKTKFPFIAGFYKTICTRRGLEGIEELKTGLKNALDEVEILKAEWPRPWFAIKENLEKTKNDFISHADYKKICEKNKIKDNKTKEILAEFLNDLGVVVHFKDLRLDRLYILQPRWASKAAYKIINSNKVAENHGLLKCDWLPEIMKKEDKNDYLYENHTFPFILDLMQKFELCYPIRDHKEYLIPELMDIQQPVLEEHKGNVLRFFFKYEDLLPRSIITRFIVRMHEDIKDEQRWRTGVVLSVDIFKSTAIIIADLKERRIDITLSGMRRREHFAFIRKTFHDLHKIFEKMEVTEWIPLPSEENHSVEYAELIGYEESGIEEYFVGKLKKKFKVKDLLDGIEPENLRRENFQWDAFLCHSSKDKTEVRKITEEFRKKNISYWLDEEQIQPGDSVIDKITDGLLRSKNIIPCLSSNQLQSGWSKTEYQGILGRVISGTSKQRITPLILDNMTDKDIPLFLGTLRCERYQLKQQFKRLVEYLAVKKNFSS